MKSYRMSSTVAAILSLVQPYYIFDTRVITTCRCRLCLSHDTHLMNQCKIQTTDSTYKVPCCLLRLYSTPVFTARGYARAVLQYGSRNSVCPSVRPWINTNLNGALHIFWYHKKRQSLCYSDTNSSWWATLPSLRNLRSKWPTPFEKSRLRQISA